MCGGLILGFFPVKENTWGMTASHLTLILKQGQSLWCSLSELYLMVLPSVTAVLLREGSKGLQIFWNPKGVQL